MKRTLSLAFAIATILLTANISSAQPKSLPPTTPTQSPGLKEAEVKKLIQDEIKDGGAIRDRVQADVNRTFGISMTLLQVLLGVLAALPIFTAIVLWCLRESIKKQLVEDAEKQVKRQLNSKIEKQVQEEMSVFKNYIEQKIHEADTVVNMLKKRYKETTSALENSVPKETSKGKELPPEQLEKIHNLLIQFEDFAYLFPSLTLPAEVYFKQGNALFFEKRYKDAIEAYNKALDSRQDFSDAWIGRGDSLDELGQYKEAVESYNRALELKSDDYIAWYNRGISLGQIDCHEEAIESYDKALELKSDFPEAWINRGYALNKLGCHEEAIASCEEALEYKPDHPQAWFNIACSQIHLGEIDQAIASLQKAIEINPKFREQAKTDSDFDAIRNDDRFQQLLAGNSGS
jgi:tetratricopeptide (TPR) repeat protein